MGYAGSHPATHPASSAEVHLLRRCCRRAWPWRPARCCRRRRWRRCRPSSWPWSPASPPRRPSRRCWSSCWKPASRRSVTCLQTGVRDAIAVAQCAVVPPLLDELVTCLCQLHAAGVRQSSSASHSAVHCGSLHCCGHKADFVHGHKAAPDASGRSTSKIASSCRIETNASLAALVGLRDQQSAPIGTCRQPQMRTGSD